jgi:hypothetical protein
LLLLRRTSSQTAINSDIVGGVSSGRGFAYAEFDAALAQTVTAATANKNKNNGDGIRMVYPLSGQSRRCGSPQVTYVCHKQ